MNEIKRISATQLSLFSECPRKWWAHYVKRIKRPESSEAIKIGLAVHKILEVSLLATQNGMDQYADPNVLLPPAVKEWELSNKDRVHLSMMLENAKRMGWFEDHEHSSPEFEKVYTIDDIEVIVKIDRLLKTPDHVRVVDLKSGKYPYEVATLKENWQTRMYSLPFLEEFDKVKMEFWFLRFFYKNIACELDKEDYKIFIDETRVMIDRMRSCTGEEFKTSRLCQWCPFFEECQKMNTE